MKIQRLLGSDIQMVLDEYPAFGGTEEVIEKSLTLSMRWATRSGCNAQAFTWDGALNLRNVCHTEGTGPIDTARRCSA